MKKILPFAFSLVFGLGGSVESAKAQTLVNSVADLAEGDYIVLKAAASTCEGQYLNGNSGKTAANAFSTANIYVVEFKAESTTEFYLKQYSTNKYIGKNGNNLSVVDNVSNAQAAAFTIKPNSEISGDWGELDETERTQVIRFVTSSTFLNSQGNNATPKYATGTGNWSIWLTYKITEEQLNSVIAAYDDAVKENVASINNYLAIPIGALGYTSYVADNLATIQEALAPVNAYTTCPFVEGAGAIDAEKIAEVLNNIKTAPAIPTTITDGGLYRLKNVNRGRMLSVKVAGDDVNSMAADENALNNIVQLVPAATEGRFYVKLQGRGLTVPPAGSGKGSAVTIGEGNGHEFTVAGVTEGSPYFYFADAESTDQTYNCLHDDNNNDEGGKNVVGWTSINTSSQWYLLPVEEISVSLNAVEGKSYATLCLPFNAELTSGNVTAYQGEMGATGDVINIQSITGGIAANEGFLLVSEEGAATATFNVANPAAAADFTGNVFEGTNVQITGASDMYVLNNGSYGVGFYVLNGTLAPNRAYIPKTSAASALTFNFGGETTGIGSVENGATDNAPVYDLGGRRVIKPAKGIYIVNGKKVYVK